MSMDDGAAGGWTEDAGARALTDGVIAAAAAAAPDCAAAANRARLAGRGVLAVNLLSAPGAGRTDLLRRTIHALAGRLPVAAICAGAGAALDAARLRATGAPATRIDTGEGRALDAAAVSRALDTLDPPAGGLLFIENVGDVVAPPAVDLGEGARVALFSAAEGVDKPLKHPALFAAADLVILSKPDLATHCGADLDLFEVHALRANPAAEVLRVSARTGEGVADWLAWLETRRVALGAPACAAQ